MFIRVAFKSQNDECDENEAENDADNYTVR